MVDHEHMVGHEYMAPRLFHCTLNNILLLILLYSYSSSVNIQPGTFFVASAGSNDEHAGHMFV